MKTNKKIFASILGFGAVALTATATYAYQGNPWVTNSDCIDTERQTAVTKMFAQTDYSAFKELFADKGVARRITTEDQFLKFAELRKAQTAGDTDKVNELKTELGLGQRKQDWSGSKTWKLNGG